MPKRTKYPRLRTRVYKGAGGQVYVYYSYDMRPEGKPEIRLGTDYAKAIEMWEQLHNGRSLITGRLEEAFAKFEDEVLDTYSNRETRKSYARHLKAIRPVFGQMLWEEVTLPALRLYLDKRTAKVQGNREMALLQIIWNRARLWGMTSLQWPAQGVKGWKNEERARDFAVSDDLFAAVYAQADRVLKDCMDIASAMGLRVTDARTVRMPVNGTITVRASKTKKAATFIVSDSEVLSGIVQRREASKAHSVTLLVDEHGRPVSYRSLNRRWVEARDRAALIAEQAGNSEFGAAIRAMFLRDMRSRAADLAGDLDEAAKLLQHSSKSLTEKHYRTKPQILRAVR